jgi:hypothetical protein
MSATCAANLVVRNFDVLKAPYSIWLFAPLALFLASGSTTAFGIRHWRIAYGMVAAATLSGAAVSTYTFLVHASEFIHGPLTFVAAAYDRAKAPKAVIYESDAAWEWSYFPLVFSHKGGAIQYIPTDGGTKLDRLVIGPPRATPQRTLEAVAPYSDLILVESRLRTYRDIRECSKNACPKFQPGLIEKALTESGNWQEITSERSFGLYDTQIKIFRRSN